METKSCIRKQILTLRSEMTEWERKEKSGQITKKLQALSAYQQADILLGFIGYGSEVDTLPFLQQAVAEGKKVYCPVSQENGQMEFYRFKDKEKLVKGYKNIPEPQKTEPFLPQNIIETKEKVFLLMPGVVFDRDRHRIGYGKGFYDRYLERFNPYVSVAVCFACQVVEQVPTEAHDFMPDMVITETEKLSEWIEE